MTFIKLIIMLNTNNSWHFDIYIKLDKYNNIWELLCKTTLYIFQYFSFYKQTVELDFKKPLRSKGFHLWARLLLKFVISVEPVWCRFDSLYPINNLSVI